MMEECFGCERIKKEDEMIYCVKFGNGYCSYECIDIDNCDYKDECSKCKKYN